MFRVGGCACADVDLGYDAAEGGVAVFIAGDRAYFIYEDVGFELFAVGERCTWVDAHDTIIIGIGVAFCALLALEAVLGDEYEHIFLILDQGDWDLYVRRFVDGSICSHLLDIVVVWLVVFVELLVVDQVTEAVDLAVEVC